MGLGVGYDLGFGLNVWGLGCGAEGVQTVMLVRKKVCMPLCC